nr:MAG TPA: hypothetical protein [Caudoviricetes sp.]
MENLKNYQCTGCANAVMCKYIEAYDKTNEELNEYISARLPLHGALPERFHISVYSPLFHPKNSAVPRGFAK